MSAQTAVAANPPSDRVVPKRPLQAHCFPHAVAAPGLLVAANNGGVLRRGAGSGRPEVRLESPGPDVRAGTSVALCDEATSGARASTRAGADECAAGADSTHETGSIDAHRVLCSAGSRLCRAHR